MARAKRAKRARKTQTVSIERVGKGWSALDKALRLAPKDINRAKRGVARGEAAEFANELRQGIKAQSPGGKRFVPLSAATIAMRRAKGISGTRVMIATGRLIKSIKTKSVNKGHFGGIVDMNRAVIGLTIEETRPFIQPTVKRLYGRNRALNRLMPIYAKYFRGRMGKWRRS